MIAASPRWTKSHSVMDTASVRTIVGNAQDRSYWGKYLMRITTISLDGAPKAAVVLNDGSVLEIAKAAADLTGQSGDSLRSDSVQTLIEAGAPALEALRSLVEKAEAGDLLGALHPDGSFQLLSPIPAPRKNVFCVGKNLPTKRAPNKCDSL